MGNSSSAALLRTDMEVIVGEHKVSSKVTETSIFWKGVLTHLQELSVVSMSVEEYADERDFLGSQLRTYIFLYKH
jgi:hypothetical protein